MIKTIKNFFRQSKQAPVLASESNLTSKSTFTSENTLTNQGGSVGNVVSLEMPKVEVVNWYAFDHKHALAGDALKAHLGGKGAGLAEMTQLGIPVPPGFTIPTTVCLSYLQVGWTAQMSEAVEQGIKHVETELDRFLGNPKTPLLLSVRSGAKFSMPGMMDTVLNVGMTEAVARGLAELSGNSKFAWDTYRRAIASYSQIVLGASPEMLARIEKLSASEDLELSALAYGRAVAEAGYAIPTDPLEQVKAAVQAVFDSWHSDRAKAYREHQAIDHALGTGATIQAMVFGNLGEQSGTGVAFSRNPSTGVAGLMGDFLLAAQGEDVVAGTHQTLPLKDLQNLWPSVWIELQEVADRLEKHSSDMVDIEFTVENGKLWLLQTRVAKRSPVATFRAAIDMAEDPNFPVDRNEAVKRCSVHMDNPPMLSSESSEKPTEENKNNKSKSKEKNTQLIATGLAASPGLAVGVLSLDPDDAVERQESGERVILVREETSPNDVHGMGASVGLVTTLGGMVSHAAVVARAWGLAAVVGCEGISLEPDALIASGHRIQAGKTISVCGDTGRVFLGAKAGASQALPEVEKIQQWAREAGNSEIDSGIDPSTDIGQAELAITKFDDCLDCLRLIVLKGMTSADGLSEALGATQAQIQVQFRQLLEQGLISELKGERVRATTEGQAAIAALFADEQAIAKEACDAALYPFHEPNLKLKEIVTAWQIKTVDGTEQPNDHNDADYDAMVIGRLAEEIHPAIQPILYSLTPKLVRLERYQARLDYALEKLSSGDNRYMAHPLLDSYHTVWFELHEELIRLSGRNRKDETKAGRA